MQKKNSINFVFCLLLGHQFESFIFPNLIVFRSLVFILVFQMSFTNESFPIKAKKTSLKFDFVDFDELTENSVITKLVIMKYMDVYTQYF